MRFKEHQITPEEWAILEDALREFEGHPDVLGIDIGYKYSRGEGADQEQPTGEVALRFLVEQKVPDAVLKKERREPLPKAYLDLRTDVLAVPLEFRVPRRAKADKDLAERQKRQNPIQPGLSVSHGDQAPGTLGALVTCRETGRAGLLSCAHVLAPATARKGDPIYQPSPSDLGDADFDAVGFLERWVPDQDAALTLLTRTRMTRPRQFGTEVVVNRAARLNTLGKVLEKSGRGTGRTKGRVDGIGRYFVRLAESGATPIDGFLLMPRDGLRRSGDTLVSGPGDSGAIWYSEDNGGGVGWGLHVEGEHDGQSIEYGIACHLPTVLERLNVSLAPLVSEARPGAHASDAGLTPDSLEWAAANWKQLKELIAQLEAAGGEAGPSSKRKDAVAAAEAERRRWRTTPPAPARARDAGKRAAAGSRSGRTHPQSSRGDRHYGPNGSVPAGQ